MGPTLKEKGTYSKRKEFAPNGSKFFPLRVDPFSEAAWWAEKQTGSHKKVSLVKNGGESSKCIITKFSLFCFHNFYGQPDEYAAYLHDTVVLYARVLNKSLSENNTAGGADIFRWTRNVFFQGIVLRNKPI